jgi:hypothetical protein
MRQLQKLSPFRVFHRSSGKRARDSPPASLPHSPAEAHDVLARESADGRPVSPLSLKTDNEGDQGQKAARPPKMPAFLNLSDDGGFTMSSPSPIARNRKGLTWPCRDSQEVL